MILINFPVLPVCRTQDGEIVLETPLCPVQVVIREQAGIALFYALKKPIEFSEIRKQFPSLSSKELRETLSLLISAKILTTTQEEETSAQWEHHDLFFHSRSRMGRSDGPYGGTYRFKGKIPPLPGIKNCPSKKTIALYCPVNKKDQLFDSVLEKRTSIREHGHDPISIEELSEFLFRCARVKKMKILDDQEFTSRPYPGGGARYELELYPVVHHCKGLPQGIYHYHPLDHQLCEISQLSESTEKFLNDARRSSGKKEYPQVLIPHLCPLSAGFLEIPIDGLCRNSQKSRRTLSDDVSHGDSDGACTLRTGWRKFRTSFAK